MHVSIKSNSKDSVSCSDEFCKILNIGTCNTVHEWHNRFEAYLFYWYTRKINNIDWDLVWPKKPHWNRCRTWNRFLFVCLLMKHHSVCIIGCGSVEFRLFHHPDLATILMMRSDGENSIIFFLLPVCNWPMAMWGMVHVTKSKFNMYIYREQMRCVIVNHKNNFVFS